MYALAVCTPITVDMHRPPLLLLLELFFLLQRWSRLQCSQESVMIITQQLQTWVFMASRTSNGPDISEEDSWEWMSEWLP